MDEYQALKAQYPRTPLHCTTNPAMIPLAIADGYCISEPLIGHAYDGNIDFIRALLQHGANIHFEYDDDSMDVLSIAMGNCDIELIRLCKEYNNFTKGSEKLLALYDELEVTKQKVDELIKDAEMYKSFYEHYHSFGVVSHHTTDRTNSTVTSHSTPH